jgi:hypothetical protein
MFRENIFIGAIKATAGGSRFRGRAQIAFSAVAKIA